MTLDEAKKIGAIVGTADNGCSVCVGKLIDRLNETFPQYVWTPGDMIHGDEENDYQTSIAVEVTTGPAIDHFERDTWNVAIENAALVVDMAGLLGAGEVSNNVRALKR